MKKVLMTITLLSALTTGAVAQTKGKSAQPVLQVLVDSTQRPAVEVYSDTASVDTVASRNVQVNVDLDEIDRLNDTLSGIFKSEGLGAEGIAGMLFVLGVLFILFVLAPVAVIIALFYFLNRRRKDRLKLAQMAMQQGQPIPEQLLNDEHGDSDEEYQRGMRQVFVGVGLMIFLGYAAGNVGFGVGALVACIGLGKVAASKTMRKQFGKKNNDMDNNRNDLISQNYD